MRFPAGRRLAGALAACGRRTTALRVKPPRRGLQPNQLGSTAAIVRPPAAAGNTAAGRVVSQFEFGSFSHADAGSYDPTLFQEGTANMSPKRFSGSSRTQLAFRPFGRLEAQFLRLHRDLNRTQRRGVGPSDQNHQQPFHLLCPYKSGLLSRRPHFGRRYGPARGPVFWRFPPPPSVARGVSRSAIRGSGSPAARQTSA
jgi:hypothetical protein